METKFLLKFIKINLIISFNSAFKKILNNIILKTEEPYI